MKLYLYFNKKQKSSYFIIIFIITFLMCFDLGQDNLVIQELIDLGYNSPDIVIKAEGQKIYSELYSIEKMEQTKKTLDKLENKENIYLSLVVVSIISYLILTA